MSISFSEIVGANNLEKIRVKYNQFLDELNDPQKRPVQIFAPLGKKAMEEIELVREVSRYLQKKKDEEATAAETKLLEEAKAAEAAETPKEQ